MGTLLKEHTGICCLHSSAILCLEMVILPVSPGRLLCPQAGKGNGAHPLPFSSRDHCSGFVQAHGELLPLQTPSRSACITVSVSLWSGSGEQLPGPKSPEDAEAVLGLCMSQPAWPPLAAVWAEGTH